MRALILAPFSDNALARLRQRMDVAHESWLDTGRLYDPAELGERLAREDVAFLLIEADFAFEELFEAAPGLRLVGVCRNALNQVDIAAATAHGVAVTHARGRNTNAVAEMTLGLMLSLARGLPAASRFVEDGSWDDPTSGYRRFRGREIAGSTVGVVGFGQIGRQVALKAMALGARVLATDPAVTPDEMQAAGVVPVSVDELARESDFVTLHVPDAPGTQGLVGEDFLSRMNAHAFLINTGGGAVVDARALAGALHEGRIAGAALDVFEGQPLPRSSPLMSAPNILLTPHIGGATSETVERQSDMMAAEIERMLDGQPLRHVVNPEYASARAR